MMSLIRWSLVCWVVATFLSVSSANADDPLAKPKDDVAREHLQQANKLYRVREFEKAIDEYKAGALREDAPLFLYNLGQCYRQLGRYEEAIWQYERFLSRAQPTGELKASVEGFIQQMRAELEKRAMSQPPTEPAPELSKPVATSTAPPERRAADESMTQNGVAADRWYADPVGWSVTGVGLLGASIGGYLLLDAADLEDQANTEDRQEARQHLRDKADTRRTIGAVVGIGGVGLLVGGIIKLAIHPTSSANTEAASWSVGITADSVQVFGRF
jgi:tetratricopeptide (TPR) repeat protein